MTPLNVNAIAAIAHGANAMLQDGINDSYAGTPWFGAPEHVRESYRDGVRFALDHLNRENRLPTAQEQHERWLQWKAEHGWVYGEYLDEHGSPPTHPDLLPWDRLSREQQLKDELFLHIVLWAVIIGVEH